MNYNFDEIPIYESAYQYNQDLLCGKNVASNLNIGQYSHRLKKFQKKCNMLDDNSGIYLNYIDLKYLKGTHNVSEELKRNEWLYLYEGLVRSWPIKLFSNKLDKLFGDGAGDNQIISNVEIDSTLGDFIGWSIDDKTPQIQMAMLKSDYDLWKHNAKQAQRITDLFTFISNAGYFIAKETIQPDMYRDDIGDYDGVIFSLHPKYIIEVTQQIYEEVGGQLYHITTNDCWESIKKTGFIPKNSGLYADNYPGRVYMFPGLPAIMPNGKARIPTNLIGPRKESAIKFIKEMVQKYKDGRITKKVIREVYEHRYDWNKVVIISINLKDKNSYKEGDITTMYRLFDDPRTNYGVFTYENIDPVCLSLYCSYDYEDNPNLEYLFKDIDF